MALFRRISPGLVLLLIGALVGCIKPVEPARTPTPAAVGAPSPTLDPGAGAVQPAQPTPDTAGPAAAGGPSATNPLIEQFIRDRGETPADLREWYDQALGPDRLQAFSYRSAAGLPCAGFILMSSASGTAQLTNGALACDTQPGSQALAAVTVLLTSDGQPYTIVFGRVDDPSVTAVAVVFSDGGFQTTLPNAGGFVAVQPGALGANTITAINQEGNTVIQNIPQVPAA